MATHIARPLSPVEFGAPPQNTISGGGRNVLLGLLGSRRRALGKDVKDLLDGSHRDYVYFNIAHRCAGSRVCSNHKICAHSLHATTTVPLPQASCADRATSSSLRWRNSLRPWPTLQRNVRPQPRRADFFTAPSLAL